jgi:ABC-type sugar transport system substrate-binding protein
MIKPLKWLATVGFACMFSLPAAAASKVGIVVETLGNPNFACLKKAAEEEAAKHSDLQLTVLGAATGTDLVGMTEHDSGSGAKAGSGNRFQCG